MRRAFAFIAISISCLHASAAAAEPAGSSGEQRGARYPLSARLRLSTDALAMRFVHVQSNGISAPSNPSTVVAIGEQAREAYEALLSARFQKGPSGASADLDLEVAVGDGETESRAEGWRVSIVHDVIARSSAGDLGRWTLRGEAPILGAGADSIVSAFARAAADAARKFELAFADSPVVVTWLRERGVIPIDPRSVFPPRGAWVAFLDAGIGLMNAGDGVAQAFLARVGVENRLFVLQLSVGRWSGSFAQQPIFGTSGGDAQMSATEAGADLGLVARVSGSWEVRGGGGAHLLWGDARSPYAPPSPFVNVRDASFPFRTVVPSVFASVQYAGLSTAGGARIRAVSEARMYFSTSTPFTELQTTTNIASFGLAFFLGGEIPWGSSRAGGAGR